MISKTKIGKYLKKLRLKMKRENDNKSFSRDDIASEFSRRGVIISINAIAEWESGTTLPSPDNLELLAKIYNKSIDEILDGEDYADTNYSEVFFMSDSNWYMNYDKSANLYQIRNEQIKMITKRFKELLIIRIKRSFSSNEEKEFSFLFNHFYHASSYADKYTNFEVQDKYIKLKDAINEILFKFRNTSTDEQYWELQKLFRENKELWFSFRTDVHDLKNMHILKERFNNIENWQKDMLLAMFQNLEPFDSNPDKYGSKYLKRYEKVNGDYDHELVIKNEIRELINRGACLNKYFFNYKKGYYETNRIIDRLEELYNLCLKPIEVNVLDDRSNTVTYTIENNLMNRFLNSYYLPLKNELKGYSSSNKSFFDVDEIYEWFIKNDEVPEEYYIKIAKKYNIDISQEKKYWMLDAKRFSNLESILVEFKKKEKDISGSLVEIQELKTKLINGERDYKIHKYKIIGGNDEESIRDSIEHWKEKIDYSEYLKGRDKSLTSKLLDDLDNLSLSDIKEKYFEMEVIEDE